MKKLISYLIALMMVFTMIPYTAFAESGSSEPQMTVESFKWVNPEYRGIITEDDLNEGGEPAATFSSEITYTASTEEAGAILREYMVNRVESFNINYKILASEAQADDNWLQTAWDEMFEIACQHTGNPVEGDYLKKHYGGFSFGDGSIPISVIGDYYCITLPVTATFYTTYDQEEELTAAVDTLLAEIITDDMSDYEKVKAIYDYMTYNIRYDYDHLNDSTYKLQFTAYAALVQKTSVCQGYANLFYRLALECGIDARMIRGQANGGGHAWNIVELNDKYYLVDATWDEGRTGNYGYFLKKEFSDHETDAEFLTAEFTAAYPMATADYVACTEHTAEVMAAVAPTCTATGLTEGSKCAACGKVLIAQEEVAALGHNVVVDEAVEPTCTETGLAEGSHCSTCNWVFIAQTSIDALGHDFSWIVDKEATEEEAGSKHEICSRCNETRNENTVIDKLTHTHKIVKVDAKDSTCTERGNVEYYTCAECGKAFSDDKGQLEITVESAQTLELGHDWESFLTVDTEPTCTESGYESYHCSRCDATQYGGPVLPKGHTYGEWKVVTAAACEKEGLKVKTCTVCGHEVEATIKPLYHSYTNYIEEPATCKKAGRKYAYCDFGCGEVHNIHIPELDHDFKMEVVIEPTCEEKGYQTQVCQMCNGVSGSGEDIPALGHDYKEERTDTTCTTDGYTTYTCKTCGHSYVDDITKAWGHYFRAAEIIVYPTCTTTGYSESSCSCGEIKTEEIAATGHTWETERTLDSPATMQGPGYKSIHCAACGTSDEATKIKIKRIKTATVAALAYNGSNRTPNPVIKDYSGRVLEKGIDYTVVYKNKAGTKVVKPRLVGRYTAEITFKGDYSGTIKRQFNINPKGVGPVKLTKNGKKQFTAKWTKRTAQVTGYEVKYGLKGKAAIKTVKVKNFRTNTKTIKNLKSNKNYWVQVRSYKMVNGVKYNSAWTVKNFIKTK